LTIAPPTCAPGSLAGDLAEAFFRRTAAVFDPPPLAPAHRARGRATTPGQKAEGEARLCRRESGGNLKSKKNTGAACTPHSHVLTHQRLL